MPNGLLIFARAFQFGSGLILVGVVAFRWLVLLPAFAGATDETWRLFRPFFRGLNRLFIGSAVTLLLSGLALFWAVAAEMSDSSLGDALGGETLATVFSQTQFGAVCQWRIGLALIFGITLGVLMRREWHFRRSCSPLEIMTGCIAVALMVSVAWTGHAAAAGGPALPWRIAADALHLLAAAIWPAGLLPFALFLNSVRRMSDPAHLRLVPAVIGRFSNLSFIVVGILITTGIVNSIFMVGSFPALMTTEYGRILCLKLFLFLILLGIASWNRFRLLPLLFAEAATAKENAVLLLLRRLQMFVAIELGLAVAIVIVVSFLGVTPPPR